MRVLIAFVILILIGALAWALSYVSYLPRFTVSSITVVGTQTVSPRLVQAYAETQVHDGTHPFLARDNIFILDKKALARDIVGYFPRIKSADVSRESILATAVTITVTERQPFALWCSQVDDCYLIDDTGFIFTQAVMASSTDKYVFEGGLPAQAGMATSSDSTTSTGSGQASSPQANPIGQTFAPGHMPGILVLLQMLSQAEFTPEGATVENDQDLTIPFTVGFYIKASYGIDATELVRNLQLILSSDVLRGNLARIEYVDLRFGNRVYYKLKGENEAKAPD